MLPIKKKPRDLNGLLDVMSQLGHTGASATGEAWLSLVTSFVVFAKSFTVFPVKLTPCECQNWEEATITP